MSYLLDPEVRCHDLILQILQENNFVKIHRNVPLRADISYLMRLELIKSKLRTDHIYTWTHTATASAKIKA